MNNYRVILGRINSAFISTVLWIYFFLLAFVWYFAKYTPEWIVVIRIGASILSDIIWIPFGIIIYAKTIIWLYRKFILKYDGWFTLFITGAFLTALSVVFVVLFNENAFRFMFIPLFLLLVRTVYKFFKRKELSAEKNINIPLVFISALFVFYYQGQIIPDYQQESPSEGTLSVMTYNVLKDAGRENRLRVIETIRKESPDIVACVEIIPGSDPKLFETELGDLYPYALTNKRFRYSRIRSIILSKYPIEAYEIKDINGKQMENDFIMSQVNMNGKVINIVNFHLITVGHHFENIPGKAGGIKEKIAVANVDESVIDTGKYTQVKKVLEIVNGCEGPVILLGDLNDTPNSRVFGIFEKKYRNVFSKKGWGIGATFGQVWIINKKILREIPFIEYLAKDVIRIDHIFVNDEVEIISAEVLSNANGSDHKPLKALLKIP